MSPLSRHQRRILLVQGIFLWEAQKFQHDTASAHPRKEPEAYLRYVWDHCSHGTYTSDADDFDRERFFGVIKQIDSLRATLASCAPQWPWEKIAPCDRAILYLGLYEMKHTDVPPPVVMNECVELAKAFAGDKSSKFVNGVLAKAVSKT